MGRLWHPLPMTSTRACFAFASVLAFASSLGCAAGSTTGGAGAGTGTGGTGTTSTMGGATTSDTSGTTTTSSTSSDPEVAQCESCLDTMCSSQKAACSSDCFAIQACLDAVCSNLSATGASTEGDCQTYCEGLHPNGKQQLIDWVNCANGGVCMPPCSGAPYDYEQCVAAQTAGACKSANDACSASSDCTAYKTCAGACTTSTDCQNCAMGTSGMNGLMLYEAFTLCVAQTCLAEEWLPHF